MAARKVSVKLGYSWGKHQPGETISVDRATAEQIVRSGRGFAPKEALQPPARARKPHKPAARKK